MASKKNVAFLVDGKCEKSLIDKLDRRSHNFTPIKRDRNGKSVSAGAIAAECAKLLEATTRLYHISIIIIDKEDRHSKTAIQFENEIVSEINRLGNFTFDLVVTDIMFENWILSDIENVSTKNPSLLRKESNSINNEGKHGAGVLDGLWIYQSGKYSTDKISNSKTLFKSVRPSEGKLYSNSFGRLMDVLNKHSIIMY